MTTNESPDLDQLLDAFVAVIEAATYADAVRRVEENDIFSTQRMDRRPAGGRELRTDAIRAEDQTVKALYGLLDHERTMRLIPMMSDARWRSAARAEDAYEALSASEQVKSEHVAGNTTADTDGEADGVA